jgi:hypothetical protein
MELGERHIENLRFIAEGGKDGVLRNTIPHTRLVTFLKKHDLAEVCGETWIARIIITERGLQALRDYDANL